MYFSNYFFFLKVKKKSAHIMIVDYQTNIPRFLINLIYFILNEY